MRAFTDLLIFDTDKVAPSHRFEFWNDFIERRVLGVKMESSLRQVYKGRIELYGLGGAALVFAQGDRCNSYRGAGEIANSNGETPDWLLMRTNVPTRVHHCDHDEQLLAGDLILIDSKRPYERDDSLIDYTIFAMSDTMVQDWGCTLDEHAGRRFSNEHGWARLLSSHLAGVGPDLMGSVRQTPASSAAFVSHLLSTLIKMVSQESVDAAQSCSFDTRSDRARRHLYDLMLLWIRDHHEDSTITAQSLAKAFRISVRYVHKLFAAYSEGRGFLKCLQDVRLEHVVERFRNEQDARTTIAEIAWSCGFADVGSFARLFKSRYGTSPSAYRKLLLASSVKDEPHFSSTESSEGW